MGLKANSYSSKDRKDARAVERRVWKRELADDVPLADLGRYCPNCDAEFDGGDEVVHRPGSDVYYCSTACGAIQERDAEPPVNRPYKRDIFAFEGVI